MELLAEYGYHGTGLKKILDRVGVPKGSFYNYFESKERFVSEIIDLYSSDMSQVLDEFITSAETDPVETIRLIYRKAAAEIERSGQKGCLVGNLAAEIGNSSALCQLSMQQSVIQWKNRLSALFSAGQEQGLLRKDLPPETLCETLWNTWQGGLLKMKIEGSTEYLNQTVDLMLDHLFSPGKNQIK
jgi:TetR/AcrR family transcriptional repressor of nem operon